MVNPAAKNPIERYRQFMGIEDSEEITAFFSQTNIPSILGHTDFIEWVKDTFFGGEKHQEIPESKGLAPDIDDIILAVSKFYNVDQSTLATAKRGLENEARNLAVYLARDLRAERLMTIAPKFNLNRYSSVSSILVRVRQKLNSDKAFKKKYNLIKKNIYKTKGQT